MQIEKTLDFSKEKNLRESLENLDEIYTNSMAPTTILTRAYMIDGNLLSKVSFSRLLKRVRLMNH